LVNCHNAFFSFDEALNLSNIIKKIAIFSIKGFYMKIQRLVYVTMATAALLTQPFLAPTSFAETMADSKDTGIKTKVVRIEDFNFAPETIKINVGDTITWTNFDSASHNAVTVEETASNMAFDSGNLKTGESYSHEFKKAGTYRYICTYHPKMIGTVIVLPESVKTKAKMSSDMPEDMKM
jgi:plastocyanin